MNARRRATHSMHKGVVQLTALSDFYIALSGAFGEVSRSVLSVLHDLTVLYIVIRRRLAHRQHCQEGAAEELLH